MTLVCVISFNIIISEYQQWSHLNGQDFSPGNGHDDLAPKDISDCVIEGFGGKAAKPKLDDFDWDGSAVAGTTL